MAASIKGQQCEDCKNEYANQLQRTNDLQVRPARRRKAEVTGGRRWRDVEVSDGGGVMGGQRLTGGACQTVSNWRGSLAPRSRRTHTIYHVNYPTTLV